MKLEQRCREIRILLCDVDGVLTDGSVNIDNQGIETKTFNIRDGLGVRLWQKAGFSFGLITGRSSHVVQVRAAELDIHLVRQGVSDKLPVAQQIAEAEGLSLENVCYVGDDLPDLPVIRAAGLGVSVADAAEEVRREADYVTTLPGGRGAIRETVETILKNQKSWETLIQKYTG